MSVCPQCGAPTNPNDKFCNGCGFSLVAAPAFGGGAPAFGAPPPPAPQGFGAPPPPFQPGAPPPQQASPYGPPPPPPQGPGGGSPFGAPPPPPGGGMGGMGGAPQGQRCQQGHDILPGQSYCAMGHPIALDQMFASDAYGAPQGGSPFQPAAQPPPFGAPPPQGAGGGAMPVQQANYAGGSSPAFPAAQPGQYGDPGAFGQQPPPNQGFGAPPPPFGAPPPQGGSPFGGPPQGAPPPNQFGGGFPPIGGPGAPPPMQQQGMQPQGMPPIPPQQQQPPYGGYAAPPPPQGGAAAAPPIDMNPATRVLRGFLLSYQNNAQGDFWPLLGGRITVGRANAGDGIEVQLADATISSRHAAFLVDNVGGTIHIEDTGSTNGTYVNEEHIGFNGRRELKDGDRVRFGGFTTIIKVIGRV